jgi:uncharacterized protein
MATQIFVNLPVKDLNRSIEFFTHLGYTFNPNFTNENATCMIISDTIYVMLLVEPFFKGFTKKEIADTRLVSESIICLSAENRKKVDEIVRLAREAGGTTPTDAQDQGFMYQHGFEDPDGHIWEIMWMDPAAIPG